MTTFTKEDLEVLAETYRSHMSKTDAEELFDSIMSQTAERIAEDPEIAKEVDSWSTVDRVLFAIREAYVAGAVDATLALAPRLAE